MALPDRDGNFFLIILLLLIVERDGFEFEEFEPFLDETLHRLERDFERDQSFPFPARFLFERLRRSLASGELAGPRSRLRYKIDQVYSHISGRFDQLASELDRRFSDIENELEEIESRFDIMSAEHSLARDEASKSIDRISDALKTLEWALSIGITASDAKLKRSIPVRIYLSENVSREITSPIIDSIISVLQSLSFDNDTDLPEEGGSWWKRFWMSSRDLVSQEEIQDRLIKIERIAETRLLEKPQAEANKDHATAVATIMKSLDKVSSACVQIGNILLVKHTPESSKSTKSAKVIVRTLNAIEMRALEKNQTLLRDPARILQKLEVMCSTDDPLTIKLPPVGQ